MKFHVDRKFFVVIEPVVDKVMPTEEQIRQAASAAVDLVDIGEEDGTLCWVPSGQEEPTHWWDYEEDPIRWRLVVSYHAEIIDEEVVETP